MNYDILYHRCPRGLHRSPPPPRTNASEREEHDNQETREMKHNERCEKANPKGKCNCRCGGTHHGILHPTAPLTRTISERIGGGIESTIRSLKGRKFTCSCKKTITINTWLGYPHEGGLTDASGNKWWIFVECPHCKNEWSWWKINGRVLRRPGQLD